MQFAHIKRFRLFKEKINLRGKNCKKNKTNSYLPFLKPAQNVLSEVNLE